MRAHHQARSEGDRSGRSARSARSARSTARPGGKAKADQSATAVWHPLHCSSKKPSEARSLLYRNQVLRSNARWNRDFVESELKRNGKIVLHVDEVELSEEPIFIGNHKIRALQFADDLVLLARSESDLNDLLARWSSYCSSNYQETSLSKTVIAILINENDDDLQVKDGVATLNEDNNFKFCFTDHELTVLEFFV